MYDEFVDLRRRDLNSESFWPSFTDIMMVVVIIFLLTSMILMVKNWELLEQLRKSMAAEEQAKSIILDTSQENATLEEQLAQAQSEISMLRMQLLQSDEQLNQLNTELESKAQQIIIIMSENESLKQSLNDSESKILQLNSQVSTMENSISQLNVNFEKQQKELEAERRKIIVITQERDSKLQQLSTLEEDYGSLKVKYDKLIKPARSASGKYIVTVNYERINGKERIRFKDAGDEAYTTITEKQLHNKLSALKKKYSDKLYVRIIIPEKSGLTYNEAWNFMLGLLKKYDYYYRE